MDMDLYINIMYLYNLFEKCCMCSTSSDVHSGNSFGLLFSNCDIYACLYSSVIEWEYLRPISVQMTVLLCALS